MSRSIYLDYNATAKVRPEAAAAVAEALEAGGNPSSVHAAGRAARARVERARAEAGRLVGAAAAQVTFVSGGTEGVALAMASAVAAGHRRLIVGATEHEAVRESAGALAASDSGVTLETWPVDGSGVADLAWLEARLATEKAPALVCLMLANNETGVIQPISAAAALVRAAGGWLHVDAVQGAGKIPLDFAGLGADTLSISAHKLGGPQGIGALVAGPRARLARQIHGGGQEKGFRSGTEAVPAIAGFAAAARACLEDVQAIERQASWRDALAARVAVAGAVVIGEAAPRLPQTLAFAAPGFEAATQVMRLDLAGVMVSAGAACASGKVKISPVLQAMGRADLAGCAIRVSGGWATRAEDWRDCGDVWLDAWRSHAARRTASERQVA